MLCIRLLAVFLALLALAGCSAASPSLLPSPDGDPGGAPLAAPSPSPVASPSPEASPEPEPEPEPDGLELIALYAIDFTDENMAALEAQGCTVLPNENAEGGIVKGEVSYDGDEAAYKASHIEGTSYNSIINGVRLTFGEPLPAETNYHISAWFYVPEAGNMDVDGKRALIGPAILLNEYAGSDEWKWPNSAATAGTVIYDEWMNVIFDTPPFGEEIGFIDFRFYTNDAPTHPEVWYIDNIYIASFDSGEDTDVEDLPELKDAYKDYFLLGTAAGPTDLSGKRFELLLKHFDTFTFGNEMKPDAMQREEGVFTFDTLDKVVAILQQNNLHIVGHTLAWHSQSPSWMWSDKDKARERLEKHIEGVLTHVGPDLVAVDVINEAFEDDGGSGSWENGLRHVGWYGALGAEFIEIAFRKADEVRQAIGRPDLKLYYNDFNLDNQTKAQNVYDMVKSFQNKGVPIDGIGMQGHYSQSTSPENVRKTIELFNNLPGIEVSITELDITIDSSRGNPTLSEAEEQRQAALYGELFKIFKEYAGGPANPDDGKRLITRVTFWGVTDNQSWRSERHPLLFDKNNKAKGAFFTVLNPD